MLRLVLCIILFLVHGAVPNDFCKALGDGKSCVSIRHCPSVLENIENSRGGKATVLRLQRLTCGIDGQEPKVCCSKMEIQKTQSALNSIQVSSKNVLPELEECGKSSAEMGSVADYILGGKTPGLGAHPWIARLGYKALGESTIEYICGGTLIGRNLILLASHCIFLLDPSRYQVRMGEHDARKNPEFSKELGMNSYVKDYAVKEIILHPEYDDGTKQNDIALIRLSDDVKVTPFVRPICLPLVEKYNLKDFPDFGDDTEVKNRVGEVGGFGRTSNDPNHKGSETLQVLQMPIISNRKCQEVYNGKTKITASQMCAGGIAEKDSCSGDSGGSLSFLEEKTKRHFQIGIVSFGPKVCGLGGYPGIYTRISSYITWIIESINKGNQ